MRYGFAIDQNTCIGCHACTVACKTEHGVPVGQFRTWVKYVDQGTFPNNTRDFGVMRCNHCTDAPCVTICPTKALYTRDDGIVDFDRDRCIGCKGCMQGCPYDAIYIDEDTRTAAKCNFHIGVPLLLGQLLECLEHLHGSTNWSAWSRVIGSTPGTSATSRGRLPRARARSTTILPATVIIQARTEPRPLTSTPR